jgi:glycine cleavage system H protein
MDTRYTKDHEWIMLDGDIGTIGVTQYAQEQLGDIVYVELPAIGKSLSKGGVAAVVESVKAASEVYAPLSGEVVDVNDELGKAPQTVNEDAEGKGWFLKIKIANKAELDELFSAEQYETYLEEHGVKK